MEWLRFIIPRLMPRFGVNYPPTFEAYYNIMFFDNFKRIIVAIRAFINHYTCRRIMYLKIYPFIEKNGNRL